MVAPAALTMLFVSMVGLEHLPKAYDCLWRSYHGILGAQHAFIVDDRCLHSSFSILELGTGVRLSHTENLVWASRDPVDPSLDDTPLNVALGQLERNITAFRPTAHEHPAAQLHLDVPRNRVRAIHRGQDGLLLSASPHDTAALGAVLPRYWSLTPVSPFPRRLLPVPASTKQHLRDLLPTIQFDPVTAAVVNGISIPHLPTTSDISLVKIQHAPLAAAWIKRQIEATGATCALKHYKENFAPNVICEYPASAPGTSNALVVLGAHYDSRGSFGSVRAPGANDDGSGTGALLTIARAVARRGVAFRGRVQLCAFAGEEQGLVGSRAYADPVVLTYGAAARSLARRGANVTMMIQADMVGYHAPGEPAQLGLSNPGFEGSPEVVAILERTAALYSPSSKLGTCEPDHVSFYEVGFPSSILAERIGWFNDPAYHDSTDLSSREGYSFQHIKDIAKTQLAAALHVAGYDLREDEM
ncbi:Zn-dependent exopeptidase [Epithele typhae]|uniref:Zn-dependent exopeptidase n=1 Tax=Epithele typhae TaxID=378194 RepID=UPI0020081259|nr:Zn-dependent exopeptidase [Epithele typhae]KAH9916266.1 Zn-dependent exopeptidase [Epithele typhae]